MEGLYYAARWKLRNRWHWPPIMIISKVFILVLGHCEASAHRLLFSLLLSTLHPFVYPVYSNNYRSNWFRNFRSTTHIIYYVLWPWYTSKPGKWHVEWLTSRVLNIKSVAWNFRHFEQTLSGLFRTVWTLDSPWTLPTIVKISVIVDQDLRWRHPTHAKWKELARNALSISKGKLEPTGWP